MSESPNVLIAVGQSQDPNIPEQTDENIFTRYNVGGLSGRPDGDFYNQIIDNPSTPKWGDKNFDIYGFMSGDCYYTYPNSIQCMVDFFNKHDHIKVVVCDMLYDRELFKLYYYEDNTLDSLADKTGIGRNSLFNTIDNVRNILK